MASKICTIKSKLCPLTTQYCEGLHCTLHTVPSRQRYTVTMSVFYSVHSLDELETFKNMLGYYYLKTKTT